MKFPILIPRTQKKKTPTYQVLFYTKKVGFTCGLSHVCEDSQEPVLPQKYT